MFRTSIFRLVEMQTKFEIFNYVLNKHELQANELCLLMIEKNTDAAAELGFQV
jgi:hypothetical protein